MHRILVYNSIFEIKLMKSKLKNPLFVVFITIFIDLIGFGILIPIIPLLLTEPTSKFFVSVPGATLEEIRNNGLIIFGFLTASFPLAQFIATPILGQLSDKYGRKLILAISLAGTSISYVLFAIGIITKNIPLLFVSRIFDGITGGNIAVAQAAIADVSTPQNRARNFGLVGAAFGLGFILGPYLGGKLSDPSIVSWFDATTPFWFAAILAGLNTLSVLFIFPETLKNIQSHIKINWNKSITNILHAYTMKGMRPIFLTLFIFSAGFTFFQTFASPYFFDKFGFTQGNVGDLFAYVGLWMAISQAVITGLVAKRLKEYQVLRFSLIGTGIGIAAIALATQGWQLLFIMPFFAMFTGLNFANFTSLVSKSASPKVQGEVLGISTSVQAFGQSIPPILAGYIAASLATEAPLVVGSVTLVLAGILFWFIYKPSNEVVHEDSSENIVMGH